MTQSIEKWACFELALNTQISGNPFLDVTFDATFTHASHSVKVSGFYDGDNTYRVRFMPDVEGAWHFITRSNVAELDGHEGTFECTAPQVDNHGTVRVIDALHFAYADGTPYHPVGTTCYVWTHQGDALEEQTLTTLESAPFNKMRMCVFPKRYRFNSNEPPCYPFEGEVKRAWNPDQLDNYHAQPPDDFWDFTRFNPEYFRRLEKRVLDLQQLGIEADLIIFHPYDFGAWGFDHLPPEVNDRYLRYLVARLAAFRNVWWSFANEYDFMNQYTIEDWNHFFQLVESIDPYNHLRSVHNWTTFYDHRKAWVTHCSVQSSDLLNVTKWHEQYGKPVVVDECGYEGNINLPWGSLSAEFLIELFWVGFTQGGYVGHGETYLNKSETLWWSKGGQLRGESVARIAFLKSIIEAAPQPGLFPLASQEEIRKVMPDGVYKGIAAGHNGADYFLLYLARHQPAYRNFNLPDGHFKIDIIDTWNMIITPFADSASGRIQVQLPARPYLCVRIQRIPVQSDRIA